MQDLPPLWDHQKKAIYQASFKPDYGLLFEMGCGKTRTMIEIMRNLYNENKRIMRTLVLAPIIVAKNWKHEIAKFSKIPQDKVFTLTSAGKDRLETFTGNPGGNIFITNYESLLMKDLYAAIKSWAPEVLILDEAHKCKDPKSKRTKLAIELAHIAARRYILTGTPVLNSPMDIFSQFLILDRGATFGKNFFIFRATYFYDKNAGMPKDRYFPNWQIKPGALEDMNKRIYAKAMRVTKAECLDLPPLLRQTIEVGLSSEQERLYKEMKRDLITYLSDKACVAQLAITKALRLQQIVSGFVKTEDGKQTQIKETPRMAALQELLEGIVTNHKVLVWAVFKENYEQVKSVCEKIGVKYVEVHGEISNEKKFSNVKAFTEDDSIRVFIGHPGSGGIGVNLVSASYSVFFSRSFSLEHDLQAESRNHRGGSEQHEKITRIDLVAPGTIDELVLKALANKQSISDKMLAQWKDTL